VDDNVVSFLVKAAREATKHGVASVLLPAREINFPESLPFNGHFDHTSMTIIAAVDQPDDIWLSLYVHEFSHFEQWRDNREQFFEWQGGTERLFCRLEDESVGDRGFFDNLKLARALEWDCEVRTVENIKKYDLPIDIDWYTKRANAYIYFYTYMGVSKKWYEIGREPFNIPEITEACPNTFQDNYSGMPEKLMNTFLEVYGG